MGKHVIKKSNKFKKFLRVYVLILIILMALFLVYVVNSLRTYEALQVENFLNNTFNKVTESAERDSISKYVDLSDLKLSDFEKDSKSKDKVVASLLKSGKISYKLNNESIDLTYPIYDVYVNDKALFNVKLNGEKKVTRLGILTFQDWKLESIKFVNNNQFYTCDIEIPSNLKAYVNGIEVTEKQKKEGEQDEGLKALSDYVDIPYLIKYEITGLLTEPEIKIQDENGNNVDYEKEKNLYKVSLKNEKIKDKDEAMKKIKGNVNIERIAKDWSLYLTNDLSGTLHGFYNISKYLIKDSTIYKDARKWATGVDITFVSKHTLDNPTFTNLKIDNFTIYDENAFSCEVYLQKHLTLSSMRSKKINDVFNERMYFVYYEGEWKLVNMMSITNNN